MIFVFIFLVLLAMIIKDVSLKYCLKNVHYDAISSRPSVECGEEFDLVITLENRKLLPVTYIKVSDLVPSQMEIHGEYKGMYRDMELSRIISSSYLLPYQKFVRRYKAAIPCRGRYFLRGAILYGGDIFGLSETIEHVDIAREIVVLPEIFQSGKLDMVMGGFIGDMSVNRFIMEDPILTLGFREYTGREPMKNINWMQSLKASRLMVKNFDHTQDMSVSVVLNVEWGASGKTVNSALIERSFSIARNICQQLEAKKIKFSFTTNATAAGAVGHWSSVSDGLGSRHLYTILEGLGRATYDSTENFSRLLEKVALGAEKGRAHVIITPSVEAYWTPAYNRLRALVGSQCLVVSADSFESSTDADGKGPFISDVKVVS